MSREAARELIVDLHLVGRMMRGALEIEGDNGNHRGGLGVLAALAAREPCRQSELATDLCLSQSVLSRHITELVDSGYVDRLTDPDDRRATQMSLTPAGRELLYRSSETRARELQNVLADWSEAEAESARVAVQKLKKSLTEHVHRAVRPVPTSNRKESQENYV